jgi:hypothetical protein
MVTIPSAIASLRPFRLGQIKSGPLNNREIVTFNDPNLRDRIRLDSVICVVDADQVFAHPEYPPLMDLKLQQVAFADMLIHAHYHEGHDHSKVFSTWSYETDQPLALESLRETMRKLPGTVYRAKGVYSTDAPRRRAVLQVVGRRVDISIQEEWGEREPRTQIVAIGAAGSLDRLCWRGHSRPAFRSWPQTRNTRRPRHDRSGPVSMLRTEISHLGSGGLVGVSA